MPRIFFVAVLAIVSVLSACVSIPHGPTAEEPARNRAALAAFDAWDLKHLTVEPDRPIRIIGPNDSHIGSRTVTGRTDFGYLVPVAGDGLLRFNLEARRFYLQERRPIVETISYNENYSTDLVHEFYHRKKNKRYDYRKYHEGTYGRFLRIGNKPVEFKFSSSDPEIMTVSRASDVADTITITKPGRVKLILAVGDEEVIRIPFVVSESSVHVGMTEAKRLKAIGFPSSEATEVAEWPYGQSLDREYVKPTARQGTIVLHHLRYDRYPELVISVDGQGRVKSFHSNTIHVRK